MKNSFHWRYRNLGCHSYFISTLEEYVATSFRYPYQNPLTFKLLFPIGSPLFLSDCSHDIFSLFSVFRNLFMMALGKNFLIFTLFVVLNIPESGNLCLSPNLGAFQPLFLQIFSSTYVLLLLLDLWSFVTVSQVPRLSSPF